MCGESCGPGGPVWSLGVCESSWLRGRGLEGLVGMVGLMGLVGLVGLVGLLNGVSWGCSGSCWSCGSGALGESAWLRGGVKKLFFFTFSKKN